MGFDSGSLGTQNPLLAELLRPSPMTTGLSSKGGGGFFGGIAQGAQAAAPRPGAGLLETLNQQYNRPDASFQRPIAPVGGMPFLSRLKGTFRGLF